MIRLHKDAPWDEVTLKNGKINKTDWVEENLDISPIKKWVEYKQKEFENIKQENSIVEPELKPKKVEKEESLIVEGLMEKEVEAIKENSEKEVGSEIVEEKLDYSTMTKKELIEVCKEKNIDCVGKKKGEILELLTN
jgi:hypothetical protein